MIAAIAVQTPWATSKPVVMGGFQHRADVGGDFLLTVTISLLFSVAVAQSDLRWKGQGVVLWLSFRVLQ